MATSSENKRIAKNTLLLYFRMIFLSAIGLFTVRITIKTLGVVDYGIYSVVGSVVTSLSFLMGTLSSATQRYFSFYLGKKDVKSYTNTFSIFIIAFWMLSALIFILAEIIGPLILPYLTIPSDSLSATVWVYQTSIITLIANMIAIPYMSSIIAHEEMTGFAYISIFDGVLKLLLVYILYLSDINKLKLYGSLLMLESIIILLLYVFYCKKNYKNVCSFHFHFDRKVFNELFAYTGWNLLGSISGVASTQGQNILLNIFFGPVINTAKGIADKISTVIKSLSTNFFMALSPQIIKSYAVGDQDRFFSLILKSTKLSYYLLLIISFPIIICCEKILSFWLGSSFVTSEMIIFTQLMLIYCLVFTMEQPITQAIRATGNIRNYQIAVGIITLLYIPIAAVLLWYGLPAYYTMIALIGVMIVAMIVRLIICKCQIKLSISDYIKYVIIPIVIVSFAHLIVYIILSTLKQQTITQVFSILILSFLSSIIIIVTFGLGEKERDLVKDLVLSKFKRIKSHE